MLTAEVAESAEGEGRFQISKSLQISPNLQGTLLNALQGTLLNTDSASSPWFAVLWRSIIL